MAVTCKNCGGAHPIWQCQKPTKAAAPPATAAAPPKVSGPAAQPETPAAPAPKPRRTSKPSPVPAPEERIAQAQSAVEANGATAGATIAPPGECSYCDLRRAKNANSAKTRRSRMTP